MREDLLLHPQQLLFDEGHASDWVYQLQSGELEAFTRIAGRETILGRIQSGEFVGELGVLQGEPRSAAVRCISSAELKPYTRAEFIQLISGYSDHSLRLIHCLSLRSRNLLALIDEIQQQTQHNQPKSLYAFEPGGWAFLSGCVTRSADRRQRHPTGSLQRKMPNAYGLDPMKPSFARATTALWLAACSAAN